MRRSTLAVVFGVGLLLGIIATVLALKTNPGPGVANATAVERPSAAPKRAGAVEIDPAMVQNLGVRTALAEPRQISAAVRTTGYVDYDQNLVSKVNARISGWIEKVQVAYVGQEVRRGQELLRIYSPELMLTQEDYLRSRKLAMGADGSEGAARADGAALMAAAKARLRLWGIAPAELGKLAREGRVSETVPIQATASGVVTATSVVEGAHVRAGDDLYTIADLSRVWVYADIYERELKLARVGQQAVVISDALPAQSFTGRVDYIYPAVDPQSRTVKVRLQFQNPTAVLKPGMYVKVTLLAPAGTRVLAVPSEAVLNSGVRQLVILALGQGRYAPREVQVGADSSSGYVAILSGLKAGDRVVTSAQFLIDSESNLNEALSAMTLGPTPGATPGHSAVEQGGGE